MSVEPKNQTEATMETLATIKAYGGMIRWGLALASVLGCLIWMGNKKDNAAAAPPQAGMPATAFMGGMPAANLPAAPVSIGNDTVSFTVASTGSSPKTGAKYLNSQASFRTPGNVSIKLTGAAANLPAEMFKGRTVSATGPCRLSGNGSKEVTVSDAAAVRVQ